MYDVVSAKYKEDYKIEICFENGKSGVVDFKRFIDEGGIFTQLKDLENFRNYEINKELGVITWNKEVDIAPETLYSEATGEPLPEWMEEISESGAPIST
jgi:hypothetical protein